MDLNQALLYHDGPGGYALALDGSIVPTKAVIPYEEVEKEQDIEENLKKLSPIFY